MRLKPYNSTNNILKGRQCCKRDREIRFTIQCIEKYFKNMEIKILELKKLF